MLIKIALDGGLQRTIISLNLAVRLRMVRGREVIYHVQDSAHILEELSSEALAVVRQKFLRRTIVEHSLMCE